MNITFLGTGTSSGIPIIGCDCPVCMSANPKNKRLRSSILVEADGVYLVVDTAPDFREQALRYRIPRVDAVLFTHAHADHVFGFDDIRRFNTIQGARIPAYGAPETINDLRRIFSYIGMNPKTKGLYRPDIEYHAVDNRFKIGDIFVEPLPVEHGGIATFGYVFEHLEKTVGYFPDCHEMSPAVIEKLRGIDIMILDALRYREHRTHLTVEASIAILKQIGAHSSYMTHMCHDVDHDELEDSLPTGMHVSYDGLVLTL
ncbi:MAG: MBL fold metallo-hydrolase [Lentisphaerae bacterium]|nr:MBL fold metallo-hydrolase [Lentisphaerota bacterium]